MQKCLGADKASRQPELVLDSSKKVLNTDTVNLLTILTFILTQLLTK